MLGGRAAIVLLILLLHHEREPSLFGQLSSQNCLLVSIAVFRRCWYPWMLFFGWIGEHHIPNYVTSIPAMNNSLESSASGNSTNPANFHDHYCETRRKFTPKWFTNHGWKCLFCAPKQDIVLTDTALSHHIIRLRQQIVRFFWNFTPEEWNWI